MVNTENITKIHTGFSILLKVTLIVLALCFVSIIHELKSKLARSSVGAGNNKNTSELLFSQELPCTVTEIIFNDGISAEFCVNSPVPVVFRNQGQVAANIPVLILQAIVFSITYDSAVFEDLLFDNNIIIKRNDSYGISIWLPGGLQLSPLDAGIPAKIDFVGKLGSIARIWPDYS